MIRVRATAVGYYGNTIQPIGTEFEIQSRRELGRWMEVLEDRTPKTPETKEVDRPLDPPRVEDDPPEAPKAEAQLKEEPEATAEASEKVKKAVQKDAKAAKVKK